jgi:hypothetical protein
MIISSINNNSTANLTEIPKDLRSSSRSENERLCSLDPSSICPRKRCVQKATYPAFRDTFFHDPLVNPRLRQEGRNTEATSEQKLNKRTLVSKAPNLRTHEPKTMVRQGSAFFNPSVDKLYSTNKRTLGYEVSRK